MTAIKRSRCNIVLYYYGVIVTKCVYVMNFQARTMTTPVMISIFGAKTLRTVSKPLYYLSRHRQFLVSQPRFGLKPQLSHHS